MNTLRYINENWDRVISIAEDPYSQIWRELFHYAGDDAAKRAFSHASDRATLERFRSAIRLADEFVQEFEDASEIVDPVPLYYGALWLGLAMSYVTLTSQQLATPTSSHGLSCNFDANVNLNSMTVEAKDANGSLSIINGALGGKSLLETRFSMLDLLRALPRLRHDLEDKLHSTTTALKIRYDGGEICCQIEGTDKAVNEGYLRDNFLVGEYLIDHDLSIVDTANARISWTIGSRPVSLELDQICVNAPDGHYLFPKIRQRVVSEYCVYLMVLYQLSVLARYKPNIWLPLIENQTDSYFVIRSFIADAKRSIPQIVLNHLSRKTNEIIPINRVF